jgi:hypothetical protein
MRIDSLSDILEEQTLLQDAVPRTNAELLEAKKLLETYLGMSVTTKNHLAEDHSVEQMEDLGGIGNLGEDFGERNHQNEAKADRHLR